MKPHKYKSIVLLENIGSKAARDIVHGVMRYAATHPGWAIEIHTGHPLEHEEDIRVERPDGIISGFSGDSISRTLEKFVQSTPTVFTCVDPAEGMRAPHVCLRMDDGAIGRAAAATLAHKHLKSFGFLGTRQPVDWSNRRFREFKKALLHTGLKISAFSSSVHQTVDVDAERLAIANWIMTLDKPCGIFAATDRRARLLIDACMENNLNVPEQVKVIGVDNDETICESAHPSISSIEPDFVKIGLYAASILNDLMDGRRTAQRMSFGVRSVQERISTSDRSGSGNRVSLAMDKIRAQAIRGVSVPMIARCAGCSVRLLEKDFKSVYGHSIIEEVNRFRLGKVQEALRNTSQDITTIAALNGFRSVAYLRNLFKKKTGMTIGEWRKKNMRHQLTDML